MRYSLVLVSLALALGSAACASRQTPPPPAATPPKPAPVVAAPPAVPPGHLARVEVDRVLTTQGPPWVLRRILSEEVIRKDGKFAGWRLVGLPEEWKDLDLKPGDIVTRVNGLPLETPDQAWEAWKSVASSPELKISVMRDGAARQLTLPIDGPPSAETAKALGRDPGPQRASAPQERRGTSLGGTPAGGDEEAY
jgi:hypothetical protein